MVEAKNKKRYKNGTVFVVTAEVAEPLRTGGDHVLLPVEVLSAVAVSQIRGIRSFAYFVVDYVIVFELSRSLAEILVKSAGSIKFHIFRLHRSSGSEHFLVSEFVLIFHHFILPFLFVLVIFHHAFGRNKVYYYIIDCDFRASGSESYK